LKNIVGADLYISSLGTNKILPERELRKFLNEQSNQNSAGVLDYSFGSRSVTATIMHTWGGYTEYKLQSSGAFPRNVIKLYPVEENYLNATFSDYYMPHDLQNGLDYPLINGKKDAVWSLYSNDGITKWEGGRDKFNVDSSIMNKTSQDERLNDDEFDDTEQIKIIVPQGIKNVLSLQGGNTALMKVKSQGKRKYYRTLIRGMPRKIPGYFFLSYSQVQFMLQGLVSYDQAIDLIHDIRTNRDNNAFYNGITQYKNCKKSK
jgi:hypothetical protein